MGRTLLTIGLFLAALAVVLTLVQRRINQNPSPSAANAALPTSPAVPALRGKPAPDFELPNLAGAKVHPSDFKDKVLLVNFWATWCAPCIVEIPWFIEFQNKYGSKGLQVIGISLDETGAKDVVPFVKKHNMSYPILLGNDKVAAQFGGILGLPTTFIVDKNGKYYAKHQGLVSRENVEAELVALLGKSDSPATGTPAESAPEENLFESIGKNR